MRIDQVLMAIDEPAAVEALQSYWDESVTSLGTSIPEFLQLPQVQENRIWSGFGPDADPLLISVAQKIQTSPELTALAWHCYQLLFAHHTYTQFKSWPLLEKALGEQSGCFYLLVAMGMVPKVRALHAAMGVPEHVTRDTCTQVSCIAQNYAGATGGLLGFPLRSLYWLRHYPNGSLFRLGRFEYKLVPFAGGTVVFRQRTTGRIMALAPHNTTYSREGYVDSEGGKDSWVSSLVYGTHAVCGYPISPLGMALHYKVELPNCEWECVLDKGDTVLDLHIPEGGGMSPAKCWESLQSAAPFFRAYFPDKPFRAISSYSWIFNNQLEQVKLSSNNLVTFQHELYLFPVLSSSTDGLWFIFNREPFNLATAPRNTSLQRGVAGLLATGQRWRSGGMFLLTEHLQSLGTQVYRTQWQQACTQSG